MMREIYTNLKLSEIGLSLLSINIFYIVNINILLYYTLKFAYKL